MGSVFSGFFADGFFSFGGFFADEFFFFSFCSGGEPQDGSGASFLDLRGTGFFRAEPASDDESESELDSVLDSAYRFALMAAFLVFQWPGIDLEPFGFFADFRSTNGDGEDDADDADENDDDKPPECGSGRPKPARATTGTPALELLELSESVSSPASANDAQALYVGSIPTAVWRSARPTVPGWCDPRRWQLARPAW